MTGLDELRADMRPFSVEIRLARFVELACPRLSGCSNEKESCIIYGTLPGTLSIVDFR